MDYSYCPVWLNCSFCFLQTTFFFCQIQQFGCKSSYIFLLENASDLISLVTWKTLWFSEWWCHSHCSHHCRYTYCLLQQRQPCFRVTNDNGDTSTATVSNNSNNTKTAAMQRCSPSGVHPPLPITTTTPRQLASLWGRQVPSFLVAHEASTPLEITWNVAVILMPWNWSRLHDGHKTLARAATKSSREMATSHISLIAMWYKPSSTSTAAIH